MTPNGSGPATCSSAKPSPPTESLGDHLNATKLSLCLLAALTLAAPLPAQQSALMAATSALPEEPQPQASATIVPSGISSSQDAPPPQTTPQTPAPTPQNQTDTDADRKARGDAQIREETHQRIAGVLPAFNSVQADKAVPLNPGQKFHLFFRGSIDPYQFVIAALDTGLEEAQDDYTQYHWGTLGFLKRYGATYADTWDGNFWGNAVLPSLLHQDPRYYRLGRSSGKTAWHRLLYAAGTTVICHSDKGKLQPNYSNVLGNLIGGGISNIYYPSSDRGVGLTFERALTTTAEGAVGAELIEFYPDFQDYMKRRHQRKLDRDEDKARDSAGAHTYPQQP